MHEILIQRIRLKMKMLNEAIEHANDMNLPKEDYASNGIWLMKVDNLVDTAFTYILTKKGLKNLEKYVPDFGAMQ